MKQIKTLTNLQGFLSSTVKKWLMKKRLKKNQNSIGKEADLGAQIRPKSQE